MWPEQPSVDSTRHRGSEARTWTRRLSPSWFFFRQHPTHATPRTIHPLTIPLRNRSKKHIKQQP